MVKSEKQAFNSIIDSYLLNKPFDLAFFGRYINGAPSEYLVYKLIELFSPTNVQNRKKTNFPKLPRFIEIVDEGSEISCRQDSSSCFYGTISKPPSKEQIEYLLL